MTVSHRFCVNMDPASQPGRLNLKTSLSAAFDLKCRHPFNSLFNSCLGYRVFIFGIYISTWYFCGKRRCFRYLQLLPPDGATISSCNMEAVLTRQLLPTLLSYHCQGDRFFLPIFHTSILLEVMAVVSRRAVFANRENRL